MTITAAQLDNFLSTLRDEEKSAATLERYGRDIRCFAQWLGDAPLTHDAVLNYKAHLTQHYAADSVNSILAALNRFLSLLDREDCRVRRLRVQYQAYAPEEREITAQEYAALVRTARETGRTRLALVLETICATGIRISELPAITAEAVKTAGFDSLDAAAEDGTAFVFMGHGTSHTAKVSYTQMQSQMNALGYKNVFIGTVEGEPEETACENVIEAVKAAGYTKVVLRPLMVVAGDHANNDMAGDDEDSWKSQFEASGKFDSVDCQIAGLGEVADIQQLYVAHTKAAVDSLNG